MKRSRLRDLKGKEVTILDASATLTSQATVTLYKHIVSWRRDVMIVCGFVRLLHGGIWLVPTQVVHYKHFSLITILLAVHPKTDPS